LLKILVNAFDQGDEDVRRWRTANKFCCC